MKSLYASPAESLRRPSYGLLSIGTEKRNRPEGSFGRASIISCARSSIHFSFSSSSVCSAHLRSSITSYARYAFITTSVTDTGMRNAAVFNRGKNLDSLIPGKAGIGQKSFDDFSAYSLAVLNVSFAARLLIGFTFLLSQAGLFTLLCLSADAVGFFLCFAALRFDSGLFVSLSFLLGCNAISLCLLGLCFQRSFPERRFFTFTLCALLNFVGCCGGCQSLNFFFMGNALALSLSRFISLLTIESVIHQQGHFVVRLNTSSQLTIELFIHGQRFGMQCVHGFFGLNAFLLRLPFSQRLTCRIAQLVTCVNEPLNFRLSRAHSLFKALQVLAPRLFDCRLAA
nr:MAG TPA: hypothetical protein [Caudoviricetes sp.]